MTYLRYYDLPSFKFSCFIEKDIVTHYLYMLIYCIKNRPIKRIDQMVRFVNETFLMIRENVLVIMDSNYRPNSVETNKKEAKNNDNNNDNNIACNFLP